jgi:murein DD-endopeptidase MepM/ murein hydrolase activator NlpD
LKPLLLYCLICLPLKNLQLSSGYGYRHHPVTGKFAFHNGVDLRASHDTVFAVMDGPVASVTYDSLTGICIRLDHGTAETLYGHLSHVLVSPGDTVAAGQPIGMTGSTGRVTGEHLHFSVRCGRHFSDPLEFIYQKIKKNKNHE